MRLPVIGLNLTAVTPGSERARRRKLAAARRSCRAGGAAKRMRPGTSWARELRQGPRGPIRRAYAPKWLTWVGKRTSLHAAQPQTVSSPFAMPEDVLLGSLRSALAR